MSIQVIDPRGICAKDWCNFMGFNLVRLGLLPAVSRDEEWKIWAITACSITSISAKNPPNPTFFDKWDDWATRFIDCIR